MAAKQASNSARAPAHRRRGRRAGATGRLSRALAAPRGWPVRPCARKAPPTGRSSSSFVVARSNPYIFCFAPGEDMRLGLASIMQWIGFQSVTIAAAFGKVVRPTFTDEDPSSGHSYEGAQQILAISGTFVELSNGPPGEVLEGIVRGPLIAASNVLI
ncbi:PPC domain [Dillenia turbinata]|uniref:PPC domain n=1 Tax=Dillenia turbinata TaxID=194707 RepID=A0AAN8UX89_9MAGN